MSTHALSITPGRLFGGRYQVAAQIAVGGMGEVWRATDKRTGAQVALKVLRPELAGQEVLLRRMNAEARNAEGLSHENLAAVLDHGTGDNTAWIVMELVDGKPLTDMLRGGGRLAPAQVAHVLACTARALYVAHQAGIIHRDVKPSNLLITPAGQVKLTDFGISIAANQTPMTQAGQVMGTAQYLAPEQAMGRPATPAGDLYALGVVAYEALAGRRPFTGKSDVDIAFAHVNQEVPRLPADVPSELADLVYELLVKEPSRRPRNAQQVADRLQRIATKLDPQFAGADIVGTPALPPGSEALPTRRSMRDARGGRRAGQPRARLIGYRPQFSSDEEAPTLPTPTDARLGSGPAHAPFGTHLLSGWAPLDRLPQWAGLSILTTISATIVTLTVIALTTLG
ncbi:serine/threonine protein kinase [Buchananella hordeovulneris]|uniref:serine/threonine-protein kinase n=1 Tax=Buchananella hordeovulneris TaxID=52770 RepID=UPI000F5E4A26|nr:serine/threonine-protein kinase [Buchananella hordeovulneris]RRD49433.1 serine/threonine protein kinase [Buchananella hordeovulneris]